MNDQQQQAQQQRKFMDNRGREWLVSINVAVLGRLNKGLGVTVSQDVGSFIERLADDPVFMADALYLVCKPEADARQPKVSDEDFGASLAGDAIAQATDALVDALIDFQPSQRRNLMRQVADTSRLASKRAMERAEQRISEGVLEQFLGEKLEQADGQLMARAGEKQSEPKES